uniref:C-type lectin domain-containing protein n=1 Tax=Sander lucioperca TaxID=283035 RepID=A0A8C9YUX1_SANLU
TEEREDWKRKLSTFGEYEDKTEYRNIIKRVFSILLSQTDNYSQHGWVYFNHSFYYISSIGKSWQEGRDDCQQRDADLIIINNKEEQVCKRAKSVCKTHERKGVKSNQWTLRWKEDCGEIMSYNNENSWNDITCKTQNYWICEKVLAL